MSETGELSRFLEGFYGPSNEEDLLHVMRCLGDTIAKYPDGDAERKILEHVQSCRDVCLQFPKECGKDLLDYQSDAVKHLLVNRGLIAAFATGMGKTITAVSTSACIHYVCKFLSKPVNIVVVTPASLVSNMSSEFRKFPYFIRNPNSYTVVGSEIFRRIVLAKKYLAMGDDHDPVKKKLIDQYSSSKITIDRHTLLIVDEAHEFKTDWDYTFHEPAFGAEEIDSMTRAKVFMEDVVPYVWKLLLMTATPALNRWYDIINLIAAVKGIPRDAYTKSVFVVPESRIPLQYATLVPTLSQSQKDAIRSDRIANEYPVIANTTLFDNAIVFRSVDYSTGNFPERHDVYQDAVMSHRFYLEYRRVVDSHRRKKKDNDDDEAQNAFTLQRKISSIPNNPKMTLLESIVRSEKYKKISIYSRFVGPLKGVMSFIEDMKESYTLFMITGELTKSKKDLVLEQFNLSSKAIILLSDAGGQGLDFKGINASIVYEPGINDSREEQFIGRAVRYRSHHHLPPEERFVDVIKLVMRFPVMRNEYTPDETLIINSLKKSMQSTFLINQLKNLQ